MSQERKISRRKLLAAISMTGATAALYVSSIENAEGTGKAVLESVSMPAWGSVPFVLPK